jgi:uncharacterized cupredoxin-like copper-binding protein
VVALAGCQTREATEKSSEPTGQTEETGQAEQTGQAEGRAEVLAVEMTAKEFAFEPNALRLPPDRRVELTVQNTGTMEHSISIELPGGEAKLDENIPAGESKTLAFTTPAEPGEFVFYCPIEDHRDRGMEGRLTVARTEGQPPISQR